MKPALIGRERGQHISIYLTKEDNAMMQDLAEQLDTEETIFGQFDSISQFFREAVRAHYESFRLNGRAQ